MQRRQALSLGLAVAAAAVIVDQAIKALVLSALPELGSRVEVTGFLNFVHVRNTGVSFGFLRNGSDWGPLLLSGFALVVSGALAVWLSRAESRLVAVSLGLTIGGALGNVIDRLRLHAVVDFIDVHVMDWHWPAFNMADSAITLGVAGLVLSSLLGPAHRTRVDER